MRFIKKAMLDRDLFSLDLDESGNKRGDDRDYESDSHTVEERDASFESGEFAGYLDKDAVVEDDCGQHCDGCEDGH